MVMIMKFIRENYKKITIVTFIMAFTLLAFSKINSSYADTTTKEFTRKELQDMVVATATSYLRNNTYSDYDQHAKNKKHTYKSIHNLRLDKRKFVVENILSLVTRLQNLFVFFVYIK